MLLFFIILKPSEAEKKCLKKLLRKFDRVEKGVKGEIPLIIFKEKKGFGFSRKKNSFETIDKDKKEEGEKMSYNYLWQCIRKGGKKKEELLLFHFLCRKEFFDIDRT